jgi:hypothetical protein
MKYLNVTVLAAILALTPSLAVAQESASFVDELTEVLRGEGWSEADIDELSAAARDLNWDAAAGARPEVVALVLEYARESDREGTVGLERALLALEIALASNAMRQAGYDEIDIARAALEGTRDALAEIRTWREAGRIGNPGHIVRERVLAAVRTHIRTDLAGRGRERAQRALRALDDLPGGTIPADPGPVAPGSPVF